MIIGTVFKDRIYENNTVKNVPWKKHEHPCEQGCCKNELSIGMKVLSQTNWLLRVYMNEQKINEFDFNNWSEELEQLWKHWRKNKS